jgi:ParB family transcriptional regulator, chromosome partitioning protein
MNTILIQKIQVGNRMRKIRTDAVETLAESIKELGLLNPILVTPVQEGSTSETVESYLLIAGYHRLEACKQLGMTEIGVTIVTIGEVEQRLAEIDENLCRAELNHLERAEHLIERKSLYEGKYPQTKQGTAGAHSANRSMGHRHDTSEKCSFAADAAKKTNKTERNIQQAVRRANNISQDIRDMIRNIDSISDNVSELDALAKLDDADQKAAVQAVIDGNAQSIREAVRKRDNDTSPKQKEAGEQTPETKPAQKSSNAMSPEEAQEWKRKAKLSSSEVWAAKDRIRTLNKERSTLKAKIKDLESNIDKPEKSPGIDLFHDALDDIITKIGSDPTLMTPQDLVSLRNHLLKTVSIIEGMMTAINQPFSQWGE